MDHVIQLMGIMMLFAGTSGSPTTVWIPDMKTFAPNGHAMSHTAFIAFPASTSGVLVDNWSETSLTVAAGVAPGSWRLFDLGTDASVRIVNGTGAAPDPPQSLPSITTCCSNMKKKKNPKLAAEISVPAATSDCAIDDGRIDTMLKVHSTGPLVIVRTIGKDISTLTFTTPSQIVIGNYSTGLIDGTMQPPGAADAKEHFREYYHQLFDKTIFSPACKKTPSEGAPCVPVNVSCGGTPLILAHPKFKAIEIDCSNSRYP
jgi:hypothetical protein